jgi:hypothetical protein
MSTEQNYPLIPMNEIAEKARKIAVSWIEDSWTMDMDIQQKHKLASDIQNYAINYSQQLQAENEELRRQLQADVEFGDKILTTPQDVKSMAVEFAEWIKSVIYFDGNKIRIKPEVINSAGKISTSELFTHWYKNIHNKNLYEI